MTIYAENIFICIALPLVVSFSLLRGRYEGSLLSSFSA